MNPSDMVICGVTGDILLDDIQVMVPKGSAVSIPADKVVRSKDLYRALSQGMVFRLNVHSLLQQKMVQSTPAAPVQTEDRSDLESANQKLTLEVSRLQVENSRLNGEVGRLQGELVRTKKDLSDAKATQEKLDTILVQLKDRPVMMTVTAPTQASGSKVVDTSDEAPVFIPSQIRPENVKDSRIEIKEESSDSNNLAQAAGALKKMRKGTSQ